MRIYIALNLLEFSGTFYDMKKHKSKTTKELNEGKPEAASSEGIVGMLITLHTFPIESEEDLEERRNNREEASNKE